MVDFTKLCLASGLKCFEVDRRKVKINDESIEDVKLIFHEIKSKNECLFLARNIVDKVDYAIKNINYDENKKRCKVKLRKISPKLLNKIIQKHYNAEIEDYDTLYDYVYKIFKREILGRYVPLFDEVLTAHQVANEYLNL